jgi:ParB family chromosome partitioning protein
MSASEFQIVATSLVCESKTNPRRHFDERGMEELTASIRTHGVLVPLLVRSKQGATCRYEIIAGARRLRAARAAKLESIPIRIREMSDTQVLEIQILENLQRADLHPLDEALGYCALMERAAYDVAAIAAKVNKSESYVYQRLKLAELIEPAQKEFLEDRITAGHAILIARLQPKDQKEALEACFDRYIRGPDGKPILVGVRRLAGWIHENIHLDLHAAPFKKDDADLIAAAGACTTCPKRTGFVPQLFPDVAKKDTCTDRACHELKLQAHIARKKAELEGKGEKVLQVTTEYSYIRGKDKKKLLAAGDYTRIEGKENRCASAQKAIVVAGHLDRGAVLEICADPNCRQHHGRYKYRSDPRDLARRKAEEEKRKRETEIRKRILDEVLGSVPRVLLREDLELVACSLAREMQNEDVKLVARRHEWKPPKARYGGQDFRACVDIQVPNLTQHRLLMLLVELCLIGEVTIPTWMTNGKAKRLLAAAERYGVKAAAIEKKVTAEFAEKKKAKGKKAKTRQASARPAVRQRICEGCGCSEQMACPGGCAWSSKFRKLKRWVCTNCEDKVQTSAKEVA